jgi:hypothetical protein
MGTSSERIQQSSTPPRRIKLMADYDSFPLWNQSDDFPGSNIDPGELPLSDETKRVLLKWADDFDRTLNRGDPAKSGFPSVNAAQQFRHRGAQLWRLLEHELGAGYEISYHSIPFTVSDVPEK